MIRLIAGIVAALSLLACLAVPVLYFQGEIEAEKYKDVFLIASAGWFVGAIVWQAAGKKKAS